MAHMTTFEADQRQFFISKIYPISAIYRVSYMNARGNRVVYVNSNFDFDDDYFPRVLKELRCFNLSQ
jgi:hypothetical protein